MEFKTKLVKTGNSWALVIPRAAQKKSGVRPGKTLIINLLNGQLLVRANSAKAIGDEYEIARRHAKKAWDEAFEMTWLRVVGVEE